MSKYVIPISLILLNPSCMPLLSRVFIIILDYCNRKNKPAKTSEKESRSPYFIILKKISLTH